MSAGVRAGASKPPQPGMSNGGYFAHLVGKERSKTISAVASHSGPLGLQTLAGINAERRFPVLIIHGDSDTVIPPWHGRKLFALANEPKKFAPVAGADHNDLDAVAGKTYAAILQEFAQSISHQPAQKSI